MCKQTAPLLVSLSMLIIIISVMVLAGSLKTEDEISVPAITYTATGMNENNLNTTEKTILTVLENSIKEPGKQKNTVGNEYTTYINQLQNYFEKTNVNVEESVLKEVTNKITQLYALMNLEHKNDFTKMSFDGRELAIRISTEIYQLCGLQLTYSIQGNIMQVKDSSGKIIYQNKNSAVQAEFQWNALIIAIAFIVLLLLISVMIAKKHQLFEKDGAYNGFNKEGYA